MPYTWRPLRDSQTTYRKHYQYHTLYTEYLGAKTGIGETYKSAACQSQDVRLFRLLENTCPCSKKTPGFHRGLTTSLLVVHLQDSRNLCGSILDPLGIIGLQADALVGGLRHEVAHRRAPRGAAVLARKHGVIRGRLVGRLTRLTTLRTLGRTHANRRVPRCRLHTRFFQHVDRRGIQPTKLRPVNARRVRADFSALDARRERSIESRDSRVFRDAFVTHQENLSDGFDAARQSADDYGNRLVQIEHDRSFTATHQRNCRASLPQ